MIKKLKYLSKLTFYPLIVNAAPKLPNKLSKVLFCTVIELQESQKIALF